MRRLSLLVTASFLTAVPLTFAQGWGTIKGTAVFPGTPPVARALPGVIPACLGAGPILSEKYVVNAKSNGVKWVVVYLAKDDGTGKADFTAALPIHPNLAAVPAQPVVIDQPCCRFEPHVAVVRKGQNLIAKNTSAMLHNSNFQGRKGPNVNLAIPPGGQMTVFAPQWKPDNLPVTLSCGIHPWMRAYVFCVDHPYFAVTDENGNFEIKNAPAGKYRLIGWHAGWGWTSDDEKQQSKHGVPITIEDGKTTSVKLSVFKSPDDE